MATDSSFRWLDPLREDAILLRGFAFLEDNQNYHRLPDALQATTEATNPAVARLARHTAGGQARVLTDSSKLAIRATLKEFEDVSQMSAVGRGGFDCYVRDAAHDWTCLGSTPLDASRKHIEHTFDLAPFQHPEVLVHFPLYAGVEDLRFGVTQTASVHPPKDLEDMPTIAIYGTSITQGGHASRPGLAYTNLLARRLPAHIYNFGFSGNAFGEAAIVSQITDLQNLDLLVIDYEANAGTNGKLEATLHDLIDDIRRKHPVLPVLVMSRIPYLYDSLYPSFGARREELRRFQRDLVAFRRSSGDHHLYFLDGSLHMGPDWHECTTDTIHPNDIGFQRIADAMIPMIQSIFHE
jgi:lysophospholipase L1-like esterase